MLKCKEHDRRLYVGGSHGRYMVCRQCCEEAQPYLFSMLPRKLALKLLCQEVSRLLLSDDAFLEEVVESARVLIDQSQQPDPNTLKDLQRQNDKFDRHIKFVLDSPGDTDADLDENRKRLTELREQRATIQKSIARFEHQARTVPELPKIEDLREHVESLCEILQSAACCDNVESTAALNLLLRELTGGEIVVSQHGERKAQRGWLRMEVNVDVMRSVLSRLGFNGNAAPVALSIDVIEHDLDDPNEQTALQLYRECVPIKEIARRLGWNRNRVTKTLKKLFAAEGLELPDGRSIRHQHKPSDDSIYVQFAEKSFELWSDGKSMRSIGTTLGICDMTVKKALEHWCRQHELPVPTVESRRQLWIEQVGQLVSQGTPLAEVAKQLNKSTATIRMWLKKWYAAQGDECQDLRKRRPATLART